MAWSWVGTSNTSTVASNSVGLTEPAGCQEGDLLVAAIAYRGAAAATFSAPSGWTIIDSVKPSNVLTTTNAQAGFIMAYIKRGASAPPLTFPRTAGTYAVGCISAYRSSLGSNYTMVAGITTQLTAASTALDVTGGPSNAVTTLAGDLYVGAEALAKTESNVGYPFAEYWSLTRSLDNTNESLPLSNVYAVQRKKASISTTYALAFAIFDGLETRSDGIYPSVRYWSATGTAALNSGGMALFREAAPPPTNNSSFFSFF